MNQDEFRSSPDAAELVYTLHATAQAGVRRVYDELANKDPSVRRAAAQALAMLGPGAVDSVPALLNALNTCQDEEEELYHDVIRQIGLAAVPALVSAMSNDRLREVAMNVLPTAIEKRHFAIEALIDRVESPGCSCCLAALGTFGASAAPLLGRIINSVHEKYGSEGYFLFANVLAEICKSPLASLAQSLASDDENVRELGADGFVNVNVQWKSASGRIRDIVQRHENPLVRYRAVYLFGRYGKAAARILTEVKSLLTWLGDNEKEEIGIRALALTALAKIEAELPHSADIPLEFPDRDPQS